MSGFSPEWLHLREGADRAARNTDIASAVAARFALRKELSVVDLGCGTGANLRATAPLLPDKQSWVLIDNDLHLLEAARSEIARWADHAETRDGKLFLKKGHAEIDVTFIALDLAVDLERAFISQPALVTASALFDLVSEPFIRKVAKLCAERNAAFYTVLTYNGVQRWTPHRPADNQIAGAFHRHQLSDKGFGPAAGPMAPSLLADQFRLHGYSVLEGESPWLLARTDRTLLEELQRGYAIAAAETNTIDAKTIETWIKVPRHGAEVGHTDIFAAPGSGAPMDF